jgi:16S rRNA (cytosine967-C5)-methyltransferase
VADYIALAEKKGLEVTRGRYSPAALIFPPDTPFSELPGFKEGLFMVQGEASMLPALCLDLQPDQHVLDMCSAPGGKATQMAEVVSKVTACDLHPSRLKLIRANASRMGLGNIQTLAADAASLGQKLQGKFDRILLDAPCSGLGVIRKKPDIKWSRGAKDIGALAELQLRLLHSACDMLNGGGILVYSTCTLVEDENEGVIRSLLEQRSDMQLGEISLPQLESVKGQVSTFPHLHDLDGFFIANLTKVV